MNFSVSMLCAFGASASIMPSIVWGQVAPRYSSSNLIQLIEKRYTIVDQVNKTVNYLEDPSKKGAAFTWDLAVYFSALAEGMRQDYPRYRRLFDRVQRELIDERCQYEKVSTSSSNGTVAQCFAVLPNQGHPDRYYDDNAWLALALAEANEARPHKPYLQLSKNIFNYLLSGLDDKLGGGIYWHEISKTEKNVCINAPAANVALRLYIATREPRYLSTGKELLAWCTRIQDADGLFFDNINLQGKIEKTKWSYNTALPIQAHCLLWQIEHKKAELAEALREGAAAREHWVDKTTGAIKDDGAFAHHLVNAFMDLNEIDPSGGWKGTCEKAVRWVRDHNVDGSGLAGKRWDVAPTGSERLLLWQASLARAELRINRPN